MKITKAILLALFVYSGVFAQSEFKTYENGLIYSEAIMSKLERIVDSLNLKYRTCDLNKMYYSKMQTIAHTISLDTLQIKQAKKDIENNISFEEFIRKYPYAKVQKNVLVVKFKYKDYDDDEKVQFSQIDLNDGYNLEITKDDNRDLYSSSMTTRWIYDYQKKTQYSEESLEAFFFTSDFKSAPIKQKYSRQIGYSNCLIDTTTTKFNNDAKEGWVSLPENWQNLPIKKQQQLLEKMRSTRVVGFCSQDSRPREHAINIALLSAQTTNWETFLKSHLDIMNDRFDRMSDGSYAWAQRKTYIRELEELDINLVDLLMGISFRIENPADNHYYGSIGRLGRAISESGIRKDFEKEILSVITDNELDDYNRVIGFYLFMSYNNYLEDKSEQKQNIEKLKQAVYGLPIYIREKISL